MDIDALGNVIDFIWYLFVISIFLFFASGIATHAAENNNRERAYKITRRLFVLFILLMGSTAIAGIALTIVYTIMRIKV